MTDSANVSGTLLTISDATGEFEEPVEGVLVYITQSGDSSESDMVGNDGSSPPSEPYIAFDYTAADGSFLLADIPAGSQMLVYNWLVDPADPTYSRKYVEITVGATDLTVSGADAQITSTGDGPPPNPPSGVPSVNGQVLFPPGYSMPVQVATVYLPTNQASTGAPLTPAGAPTEPNHGFAKVDADGWFSIVPALPFAAGSYKLIVVHARGTTVATVDIASEPLFVPAATLYP